MSSTIRICVCILLLVAPSASLADEASTADDHARASFKRGQAAFQEGDYVGALGAFSAGYELSRRPLFLFNMAECARKLGDGGRARTYYERYLAEDAGGPFAAKARARLLELGPAERTVAPVASPKPPVSLAPTVATSAVAGGDLGVTGARGAETNIDLRVKREPAPSRPFWQKWPFWTGVGVAAAVVTVFVVSRGDGGCSGTCVDLRD